MCKLINIEKEQIESSHAMEEYKFDVSAPGTPFYIFPPPPNITGDLHIGHALNLIILDMFSRFYRMQGFNVFFPSGTDHAGFKLQKIIKDQNRKKKSSHKLSKPEIRRIIEEAWSPSCIDKIRKQYKILGLSNSWNHSWYSLDEQIQKSIRDIFISLYKKGILVRKREVLNWCFECDSSLPELALQYENEKAKKYIFQIRVDKKNYEVVTWSPFMLCGSIAIGVSRNHPSYHEIINCETELPVVKKKVPISLIKADDIDPNYLYLITPAYNALDYINQLDHGLEVKDFISETGKIVGTGTVYDGMEFKDANDIITNEIMLLPGSVMQEVENLVTFCVVCDSRVFPRLDSEWFLNRGSMIGQATKVVEKEQLRFNHEKWKMGYHLWLNKYKEKSSSKSYWREGLNPMVCEGMSSAKEWMVTNKSAWGQEFHFGVCVKCNNIIFDLGECYCDKCGGDQIDNNISTIDLQFSTAIWADSLNPWSDRNWVVDLTATGHDIFWYWISSSSMILLEEKNKVPFLNIVIHGHIVDERGEKMTKTTGNVIAVEQAVGYSGIESLRCAVFKALVNSEDSNDYFIAIDDVRSSEKEMLSLLNCLEVIELVELSADKQRISKIKQVASMVIENIKKQKIGPAYAAVQDLISNVFAWNEIDQEELETALQLIHPFHPFVSDYIYKTRLGGCSSLSGKRRMKFIGEEV